MSDMLNTLFLASVVLLAPHLPDRRAFAVVALLMLAHVLVPFVFP